ncbi:hypothetical protein [Erwinia sp. HR93]|uniref:hypothetical protein n=1 Tax=Erwinia sp. HR93 TaxID=3094840 RepID=UPI002ADEF292|nr:hypothetical protein [Erwinia sp. HR93]MEA1064978.1 hypothetical protein [Erwinia sp. HR93]
MLTRILRITWRYPLAMNKIEGRQSISHRHRTSARGQIIGKVRHPGRETQRTLRVIQAHKIQYSSNASAKNFLSLKTAWLKAFQAYSRIRTALPIRFGASKKRRSLIK